jgi:pimeloyl-ACP methyl ester carboxylesterase
MTCRLHLAVLIAASLATAGCTYRNNLPLSDSFIRPAPADCQTETDAAGPTSCPSYLVQVFADANGTLYPSGWQSRFRNVRRNHSLLNGSSADDRAHLAEQERIQLDELARLGQAANRVIILVHGYNNDVGAANAAYQQIETQIQPTSTDLVVRFYWDGLIGDAPFGAGRIWFYATGNSQLVGSRALRKVIAQFGAKPVYLIGHSRGASVILSALGNPVYNPRFRRDTCALTDTWGETCESFIAPTSLPGSGGDIHVLLAAPAIDRIDFCDARHQPKEGGVDCRGDMLRPLGQRVKSFRYTVNSQDRVLRKFVGVGGSFNPTRLGLTRDVGDELRAERYSTFQPYPVPASPEHEFTWYVQTCEFAWMLHDARLSAAPNCSRAD